MRMINKHGLNNNFPNKSLRNFDDKFHKKNFYLLTNGRQRKKNPEEEE